MKKNMKSILAKGMALAMAFSLMAVAPGTQSEAAKAKKPTMKKKVSIVKGKSKTIKVTSKKKVKKTTWSLNKKGKKVVKLSKKKAKSVKVKALKKGTAKLTAKVKVGKKTYKLKSTITVTAPKNTSGDKTSSSPSAAPSGSPSAAPSSNPSTAPSADPYADRVHSFTVDGATLTVDESATYNVPLTELNETTFTCESKRPADADPVVDDKLYNRDGSVSFTSSKDYNSGVTYYVNPCTSDDDIVDISATRGEGFLGYQNGTKDMSAYDYIRICLTSGAEMNLRTYNGNDQLETAGFPGSCTSESYEGQTTWIKLGDYMESDGGTGMTVKAGQEKRTVFIPLAALQELGCNPATLTAFGICPQRTGVEVTIHSVDFVKVKYDTPVTGITVTSNKENNEVQAGRTATLTAAVAPENATRKTVTWSSSDETLATVNFNGIVTTTEGKTGKVTITATATDGSGVTGTIELNITDGSAQPPAEEGNHKVDFTDEGVVAQSNKQVDGNYVTPDADKTADSMVFLNGASMIYVNLSAYISAKNLDLASYKSLDVTYEVRDADGKAIADWPAGFEPGWGKPVHWVPVASLNGYTDGLAATGGGGDPAIPAATSSLSIADVDKAKLADVGGFNLQFNAIPEDCSIAITDITFKKE